MQAPTGQRERKSRASSTKYFTSLTHKASMLPGVEQPPQPPPPPPQPPPQPLLPPPPLPLPQPPGPRRQSVAPISGRNKPNVAALAGRGGFVVVPFLPLAPPGVHTTQPSYATTKTVTAWSKVSKDEDELFEGGWTRCVLHICFSCCMLVAFLFVLILYLYFMRLQQPRTDEERTATWQWNTTHCHSFRPVTGNLSASNSDLSLGVVRDNVTLALASTNEEQPSSSSEAEAD
ncbi:hypothetical protein V5799_013186 [Amblyomma americanum]|uniref:Uncharacterized protein n=1 Tax=Amblyomma americanum TaxID=6943 RepID=A0AAQ4E6S3_AMBAM